MKAWRLALLAGSFVLTACISQNVAPVSLQPTAEKKICIIENPAVRPGFQAEYLRQLQLRGYDASVIAPNSPVTACPLTSTYVAHWEWDLAIYMNEADIRVFADGSEVGRAHYNSRNAGLNLEKFIDAETKIAELVSELFPAS